MIKRMTAKPFSTKIKTIYKIGITGGMGSGKSSLLRYLGTEFPWVYTIDLDKLAFKNY